MGARDEVCRVGICWTKSISVSAFHQTLPSRSSIIHSKRNDPSFPTSKHGYQQWRRILAPSTRASLMAELVVLKHVGGPLRSFDPSRLSKAERRHSDYDCLSLLP